MYQGEETADVLSRENFVLYLSVCSLKLELTNVVFFTIKLQLLKLLALLYLDHDNNQQIKLKRWEKNTTWDVCKQKRWWGEMEKVFDTYFGTHHRIRVNIYVSSFCLIGRLFLLFTGLMMKLFSNNVTTLQFSMLVDDRQTYRRSNFNLFT